MSEKFRVTTKTLNKKERYAGLGFPIDLFPKRARSWEDYDVIKRWKTREEREEDRRSQTTLQQKRERERESKRFSLSIHTLLLFLTRYSCSHIIKEESKKRGKLSVTFSISLFYKKPLNKRITTETKRKKDEEIVHTLAFFFATDDILVVPLFTSTREFESIIIIFVYVAIKSETKNGDFRGRFLRGLGFVIY